MIRISQLRKHNTVMYIVRSMPQYRYSEIGTKQFGNSTMPMHGYGSMGDCIVTVVTVASKSTHPFAPALLHCQWLWTQGAAFQDVTLQHTVWHSIKLPCMAT